jgi:hypothetical protein
MIGFFRKIRKQLADDNKPLKYMRYAIGEIVLVVIGILIALSINNWNEGKKSEYLEIQFLHSLINDLERDTTFFSNKIKSYDLFIKNNKEYLSEAYETQKTYEDYLKVVGLINWDSENFSAQNATYSELTYSGQLNIFQNKDLKSKIISHYGDYDKASKHITEFNDYSTKLLANIPFGHGTFYAPIKPSEEVLSKSKQWEYINDISSERFLFNIESASLYASKHSIFKEAYYEEILEKCSTLMEEINEELKKRKAYNRYN